MKLIHLVLVHSYSRCRLTAAWLLQPCADVSNLPFSHLNWRQSSFENFSWCLFSVTVDAHWCSCRWKVSLLLPWNIRIIPWASSTDTAAHPSTSGWDGRNTSVSVSHDQSSCKRWHVGPTLVGWWSDWSKVCFLRVKLISPSAKPHHWNVLPLNLNQSHLDSKQSHWRVFFSRLGAARGSHDTAALREPGDKLQHLKDEPMFCRQLCFLLSAEQKAESFSSSCALSVKH